MQQQNRAIVLDGGQGCGTVMRQSAGIGAAKRVFRRRRSRWADVMNFVPEAMPLSSKKLLGYDDVNQRRKMMGELNVGLTGRNSVLPDNYGLALEDLARLMTPWRERACAHAPPASEIGY
jgi:hypothetical protein